MRLKDTLLRLAALGLLLMTLPAFAQVIEEYRASLEPADGLKAIAIGE